MQAKRCRTFSAAARSSARARTGSDARATSSARKRWWLRLKANTRRQKPIFEKAIATYRHYCLPWEEADTLQYWGRALLAAGDRARAIEKFDAAIEIYRSRGAGTQFVEYVTADKMRAQGLDVDQSRSQVEVA